MINENLKSLATPINDLHPLPGNPRIGDVAAVARSLERFGQRKPIVARHADGTIIAGNHTWKAAKQLGWNEIAVVWTDDDDITAQAFALADNRTADLGSYDEGALIEMLSQVKSVDINLLTDSGWSENALSDLVAKIYPITFDLEDAFGKLPDGDRKDATQMTFTLTLTQGEAVKMAINAAKSIKGVMDTENANSNGNALSLIAEEWLNGRS